MKWIYHRKAMYKPSSQQTGSFKNNKEQIEKQNPLRYAFVT